MDQASSSTGRQTAVRCWNPSVLCRCNAGAFECPHLLLQVSDLLRVPDDENPDNSIFYNLQGCRLDDATAFHGDKSRQPVNKCVANQQRRRLLELAPKVGVSSHDFGDPD